MAMHLRCKLNLCTFCNRPLQNNNAKWPSSEGFGQHEPWSLICVVLGLSSSSLSKLPIRYISRPYTITSLSSGCLIQKKVQQRCLIWSNQIKDRRKFLDLSFNSPETFHCFHRQLREWRGFQELSWTTFQQPRLVFQLIKTLLYLRNFKTFPGITTQGINNCIWTVPYGRSELSQLKVCFRKLQSQGGAISLDNLLYTHLGWCERKQLQKINIIIQSLGLLF